MSSSTPSLSSPPPSSLAASRRSGGGGASAVVPTAPSSSVAAGKQATPNTALPLEERLAMLLSSNKNSSFSVVSYLNLALEDVLSNGALEESLRTFKKSSQSSDGLSSSSSTLGQRLAELALQLQVQTSNCHEDIGRISAELQAILPRCAADVNRIQVGLDGLHQDAQSLLDLTSTTATTTSSSGDNSNSSSSSLETLSKLHSLQAYLTQTKDILTAAATWDATLSSIAPLLAQQNLVEAVSALRVLEEGERALRGMPNPEQRSEPIRKLRTQVAALLQPQLKHAISHMSTRLGPLQQCVQLYSQLGTMSSLQDEYVKHRPASMHKSWFDYTPSIPSTTSGTSVTTSTTLVDWLPSWFENVLSLIMEEKRQCQTVFGSSYVPSIMLRVLKECFRPLKASFASRLEHQVVMNRTTMSSTGSKAGTYDLESLCALYESTLQFLSLAYDSVVGAWLDLMEAGGTLEGYTPSSYTSDVDKSNHTLHQQQPQVLLYKDFCELVVQVTAPFASYQERLGELERQYLGETTRQWAYELQQLVQQPHRAGGGTLNSGDSDPSDQAQITSTLTLEDLSSATDELMQLAQRVFPLAEGAVARFELLNGGYGATQVLAVIDDTVAAYQDELALTIYGLNTLHCNASTNSAAATQASPTQHLDESHVTCALQVLLVAGTVQRRVIDLSGKTRERLAVMGERMAVHTARSNVDDPSTSTASPFLLPDALSPVEIDSIVTKAVCGTLVEDMASSKAVLQRLAGTGTTASNIVLFPQVQEAVLRLSRACQAFVFDACSAVPLRHLSGMSSLPCWKESSGGLSASSFSDPGSYGTLPQTYITQVGEHMLALVQALEPFASNADALALANEVMIDVRQVAMPPWKDFVKATGGLSSSDDVVKQLMDGRALLDLVMSGTNSYEEDEVGDDDGNEDEAAARASTAFCNAWLDAVGCAVTGRLLERIVRIPSMTAKGCEHLQADLNYLVNVLTALGVTGHPHPLIGHIADLATLDGDALSERMAQRDSNVPIEKALAAMEERLAAMRGVAAQYNY